MRIVFARALDRNRTALVLETFGKYLVGVAFITRYNESVSRRGLPGQDRIFGYSEHHEMQIVMVWEWCQVVSSPEEFMDQRGWERPPSQPQIEKPVPRITSR